MYSGSYPSIDGIFHMRLVSHSIPIKCDKNGLESSKNAAFFRGSIILMSHFNEKIVVFNGYLVMALMKVTFTFYVRIMSNSNSNMLF